MSKFSSSVAKVIDYERLSDYLKQEMLRKSIFVDLGSGDCSLMGIINKKYKIESIGVEIDEEKVALGACKGFKVIRGDIRDLDFLNDFDNRILTVHAGFCLFNIFKLSDVITIIEKYLSYTGVKEIFFEIQNGHYFDIKYPPGEKYSRTVNEILIESFGKPFFVEDEKGVDLMMNYYAGNELINSTKDRLFTHYYENVMTRLNQFQNVYVTVYQWPVRFNAEKRSSHYYIHLRKN
jgi:hypothetical protein